MKTTNQNKHTKRKTSSFVKALTSISLAVLMLIGLSSCGAKEEWPVDKETGLTEFLLGGIGPTTGEYANYGNSVKNGAQLAVNEINAAGGVNGFKFVLNFQDSQGSAESAVSAYGKQMDKGMKVSLGGTLSGENASIVAATLADGMFLLTPTASSVTSINGSDRAFRVCFSDSSQGTASAQYIKQYDLASKVAVIYDSGLDYCKGLFDTFSAECEKLGIEILTVQTYTSSTNTDFSAQISAVKASGADLVFLPIYAADAAKILTQAAQTGAFDGMIPFGCDGLDGLIQKMGEGNEKYAEGVMLLTPFAADDTSENVSAFVAAYKSNYNATPDQFAADAYDAVYAVAEALKAAGISSEDHDNVSERLTAVMTSVTVKGVTGTMTWGADGETSKNAKAMVIKDGVAVLYTK